MKLVIIFIMTLGQFLLFASETIKVLDQPIANQTIGSNSKYHVAFVDVKDEGAASGNDENGVASAINGMICGSGCLKDLGIRGTLSDDPDTDLHVICRFKNGLGMPVITSELNVVVKFVNKCTLKIVDKQTGKVLIEKSWTRKKDKDDLRGFIQSVFAEWKTQREKEAAADAQSGTDAKMTNSVSPASTATNGQAVKLNSTRQP